LAELADVREKLSELGSTRAWQPTIDETNHGHENERIAETDHHAASDCQGKYRRNRND
jgi:hypothetical protein